MTQYVWVATYSHKYGSDVSVFATKEGAEKCREEIAETWFEHELHAMHRPDTARRLADVYFSNVADESFTIERMPVL